MAKPGQTAVILPVPAADDVLAAVASQHPAAVRPGVPAHVSLLYPFLPAPAIDATVTAWLKRFAASWPSVTITLSEVRQRPGFVYLPCPELLPLVEDARSAWPDLRPYGGRFGASPEPHLTVSMLDGGEGNIATLVAGMLPVRTVLNEVWLVAFDGLAWKATSTHSLTGNALRGPRHRTS